MLNRQDWVNFLNSKLNAIGGNYKFNIVAEVGETKAGYVNGILLTNEANTSPIPSIDEIQYSFTVALLVPSAKTNKNFLEIESIVENLIDEYDNTEQMFGDVAMTLNFTLGKPETFKTEFETGETVPLYFTIEGLYGSNVTSTKKHWFLDGVEIPFESEGVYLNKDGRTNKIQGKFNTETLPTGVTKQYRFIFPFTEQFSGLQQDILSGDFRKIYTLSYYDGISYTESTPFTAKVSIFATGDNNTNRFKASKFNITFTDVDDGNGSVKYYLALIDNPFDNQTEDTRWFDSQADQQTWFATKIGQGCAYEQIKAPNLNSLDITSQVYENTHNYDMLSLVNKNYAIIKIEKTNTSTTPATVTNNYLYYYIQSCQIGADNQFLYDLRLDTIQTYLFNPNINFSDCFIEKANLNRWLPTSDEYVYILLNEQPSDWLTNYWNYYISEPGSNRYFQNYEYKEFQPCQFCVRENNIYKMVMKKPDDWDITFGTYYYIVDIQYANTETQFVADKFFEKSTDGKTFSILHTEPEDWGPSIPLNTYMYINAALQNAITTFRPNYIYKKQLQDSNKLKFDNTENSKLFTREDIKNAAKKLTKRQSLGVYNFNNTDYSSYNNDDEVNKWLKENVLCWIYYYLNPIHNYIYENLYENTSGQLQFQEITSPLPFVTSLQFNQNMGKDFGQNDICSNIILDNTTIQSNTICICAPIYKNNSMSFEVSNEGEKNYNLSNKIYIFDNRGLAIPLENDAIKSFLQNNGGESGQNIYSFNSPYLITTKVSYAHPFSKKGVRGRFDRNNNLYLDTFSREEIIPAQGNTASFDINYVTDGTCRILYERALGAEEGYHNCFLNLLIHEQGTLCEPYQVNEQLIFNKNEIIGANKNIKFNPKLLSTDFKEIKLSDQNENGYSYDLQKLNINTLTPILSASLTPDLSKIYLRLQIPEGNIYNQQSEENLVGYVATDDNTIILANDQYTSMIANTKNFYIQNASDRSYELGSSMINMLTGGANAAASMTTANATSQIAATTASSSVAAASIAATSSIGIAGMAASLGINVIGQAAQAGLNYARSRLNEEMMVDNLKNAPGSVTQAKGNIVFNSMYTKMGPIIEEWDALPKDKQAANDYMIKYGYNVNIIGNLFDYLNGSEINGRKYFNYIKAFVANINGIPISNNARIDIRERFNNGLRFWNTDTISYTKENYEKWLENIFLGNFYATNKSYTVTYNNKQYMVGNITGTKININKNAGSLLFSCETNYGIIIREAIIDTDATYTMTRIDTQNIRIDYTNATYMNIHAEVDTI